MMMAMKSGTCNKHVTTMHLNLCNKLVIAHKIKLEYVHTYVSVWSDACRSAHAENADTYTYGDGDERGHYHAEAHASAHANAYANI